MADDIVGKGHIYNLYMRKIALNIYSHSETTKLLITFVSIGVSINPLPPPSCLDFIIIVFSFDEYVKKETSAFGDLVHLKAIDSSFISAAVQNMWNAWNIRGFMILSLCMQLVLALTAPFRLKTSNGFFIFVIWSSYLLADWSALFAFGLISNAVRQRNSNNNGEVALDVMAFWASFLLIHLGGPDTITAFSLEDNALWLRHLVGLIAQLFVFLYIFMKMLPHNKLLVPTTLIFVAGVIKYWERTRALYLASLENLKKSIKKTMFPLFLFDTLHEIFKGLIVDVTVPDRSIYNERKIIVRFLPHETLRVIVIELRLLYEVLYTKIKGANSGWGKFARSIAYFSTLAAFILFCLADKQEFDGADIAITYALLGGVFILHVSNLLMLLTSEIENGFTCGGMATHPISLKEFIRWTFGQGFLLVLVVYALYRVTLFLVRGSAIGRFLNRQWSEKMGSFNLLSHCFEQGATTRCQKPGFIRNKLAEMRHTSRVDFDPKLCFSVLDDLKRKTEGTLDKERRRKVYEARGDWALEERGCHELKPYINDFEYDNTLFIWHVATEICYNIEGDVVDADKMRFSKVLSDYMMYLLVKQPKLMSPVAGITHIRYEDTCVELLRRKFSVLNMRSFCAKILELTDVKHADITEPTDEGHHYSVLKDSCRFVRLIRQENNRWEVIFDVWMELLSYAAGHCRAESHARLLSEGGEFITFVWMLMVFSGVGA